jgi:hypothetical protein
MNIKVYSCQIFEVYLNHLQETMSFDTTFEISYIEIEKHNEPERLQRQLQQAIDTTVGYDYILLLYGICGNSIRGIQAKDIPVLIPRVHDCATILLGGKDKYQEILGHRPSQGWNCLSYDKNNMHDVTLESNPTYLEYKEKYGEDNALYLFEMLFPKSDDPLYLSLGLEEDKTRIASLPEGTEIVEGSLQFLTNILSKQWDELLLLQPGEVVDIVYDLDQVITKKS